MKIEAAIFDLNGTVLDDEEVYGNAFNKILAGLGVDTSRPIPHIKGIGVRENWTLLLKKFNLKTDKTPEMLSKETQDEYLKQVTEISVRPGFEDFVDHLKEAGIRIGLATSNTWEVTIDILEKVNLMDVFDEITTAEEVVYNKPDPDLFLVAADKLGVERYECLVIEDAASGISAARRAGMKVIAISGEEGNEKELEKADGIVEGFDDITPKMIEEL